MLFRKPEQGSNMKLQVKREYFLNTVTVRQVLGKAFKLRGLTLSEFYTSDKKTSS